MADEAISQTRVCTKCGIEKSLGEFHKHKTGKGGRRAYCRQCTAIYDAQAYRTGSKLERQKVRLAQRVDRPVPPQKTCQQCGETKSGECFSLSRSNRDGLAHSCKACVAEHSKRYYAENRKRVRKQQRTASDSDERREKGRQRMARWRMENRDMARATGRKSARKARSTTAGRLNLIMSSAIGRSLKTGKADQTWARIVGYSLSDLMVHLERQFAPGMTWENYGPVWHIDHVVPKSAFNFESFDHIDFRRCWALDNLQPLWAQDNLKKHAKVLHPFQPSLAI